MKTKANYLPAVVIYYLFLFIPFFNYPQSLEIKTDSNNNKFILEKNGSEIVKIIPSSGIIHKSESSTNKTTLQNLIKPELFNWELKFSAPGKVFKDISFANQYVGYIVTELGAVYKTTDGGDNWTSVMNLGFPYYWYGVDALTADTVVISGFNNQGNIHSGVIRWSYDGGSTWTNDIILTIPGNGVGWLSHIHFFDSSRGIVSAEFSGGMHYTTNGGKDTLSWTYVQVNADLGWFAGNVDTDTSGNVFTTGIHLAHSSDFGINWSSGPPADAVFDGGVDFLNDLQTGMTGGGQISTPVSGWTHKTTDGGQTWSMRLLSFPYPVRAVKVFSDSVALAFGGNLYNEAGGIYSTTDGGVNWNLDVNTSAEMFSYDVVARTPDSIDVWCVGSTGGGTGYIGKLYKTTKEIPTGINKGKNVFPASFKLYQNYPNPFNPNTKIKFEIPGQSASGGRNNNALVTLKVYDILGNEIATLVDEELSPGDYEVEFQSTVSNKQLANGIYFYQLKAGGFILTKKMVLMK